MRHQHAMEAHMNNSFANFADLASFIAAETGNQDRSSIYEGAFMEHDALAKLSPADETEQLEIPDPDQARAAVEIVMATMIDVFQIGSANVLTPVTNAYLVCRLLLEKH